METGDDIRGLAVASDVFGRGTNQGGMREANERVVLTVLRRNPSITKAEIARVTGLSAQTVARLVGALEQDSLVLRGEPNRGRIGQPSIPLSLNPEGAVFLGMKVGRRSAEMIAIDFLGQGAGSRAGPIRLSRLRRGSEIFERGHAQDPRQAAGQTAKTRIGSWRRDAVSPLELGATYRR
jgi:hypothetical protein